MSNKIATAKPESGSPAVLPTETDDKIGRGLRAILDGPWARLRREVRETINNPDLLPAPHLSLDEQRERLLGQVKAMGATGIQSGAFSVANGGQGENGNMLTSLEMIGGVNLQLMVKAGVQWGLWGGAVDALGTERHRQYVQDTIDLKLLGAFAMTERGHGSNVRDLETTAHFDPATGEFDIHSPTPSSEKTYLGNAAKHGSIAAVFAQLGPLDVLGAGLLRLIEPFSWWINTIAHGVAHLPVVTIPANPLFTLLAYAWIIAGLLYHRPWLTLALTLAGIAWLGVAAG